MMTLLLVAACSREQKEEVATTTTAVQKSETAAREVDVAVPIGTEGPEAAQRREQERFDQQWRELQSFRAQQAAQAQLAAAQSEAAEQQVVVLPRAKTKETFKGLDAGAINAAPVLVPVTGDVRGPSVLKTQVYLDRLHFSVGALDGRWGRNSAITLWWWQRNHGLPPTGEADEATFRALARVAGYTPAVRSYTVTADDTKGPFVEIPESPYEKEKLDCLCYQSIREELAEKFHASEDFLELLNPGVRFSDLQPGVTINVPNVREEQPAGTHDIARVVISIKGNTWSGFDKDGRLLFHAPTTLGSTFDPSPDETLKVSSIIENPHFHYDPALYHEVPDSEPDAHLKPGPNSPVGVVWMALSKPHYGMHGTSDPESIGYASSHGCIRLTNWDALEVARRVSDGVTVEFVDTSANGMPAVTKKPE
jgi:lipoprotein-anchoring transpeptidase ErfK/SrfK